MIKQLLPLAIFLIATTSQAADPIEEIRELYAKTNATELTWTELKPPFEDEQGGTFKRGSADGKILKAVLSFNMGDHGGSTAEVYYDSNGAPVFLIHNNSFWRFSDEKEGPTIDETTERRIYFQNGKIIRALEKEYTFTTEAEMKAAAAKAKNKTLTYSKQAAPRLLAPLNELRDAKAPRIVVLAKELDRAQDRLTEPEISDKADDWSPVKIPERDHTQPKNFTLPNACSNLLISLGIIDEGENAELPNHIDTDILSENKDAATVVVTLDGLHG